MENKITEILNKEENKKLLILYKNFKESSFENKLRFECELEFVQSLSNIEYIKYLYENKYFDDKKFLNYLKYLNYWRSKPYIFYIHFPICLYVLEILNDNKVHEYFKNSNSFNNFIYYLKLHWLYFSYQT
ncbi:mediator complex subunit 31, putative [Plasmodium gallinaceum]|uniref:Mediator of RNA polymerase II transcription subunit 31 n=1 Tax=Plasmodium gallinaceum TaxID=5849 RepID=A0A1J1GQ74_PLAGA|nr:mediator complex subunit 31, putative [Plasmodium gallinaceum]CRG94568.1 mediator complex subunit 31, putative [Plasmodium gallinaceum]